VAELPFSESEVRFLRALLQHKVRFMVVGLSAAALQGAPVVTQDVDLWFDDLNDPGIHEALREVGAAYVPPLHMNPPMFAGGGIGLFDIVLTMHGLGDFDNELPNCIDIALGRQRLKVLSLARILASKRAANRAKDRLTIPVLEDALAAAEAIKSRKRKKNPKRNAH
jgi:hypothetical protein